MPRDEAGCSKVFEGLLATSETLKIDNVDSGAFAGCPANLEIYVSARCKDKYIEKFKKRG